MYNTVMCTYTYIYIYIHINTTSFEELDFLLDILKNSTGNGSPSFSPTLAVIIRTGEGKRREEKERKEKKRKEGRRKKKKKKKIWKKKKKRSTSSVQSFLRPLGYIVLVWLE